ncbi:galectin-8 [Tribolium castaneum]|uniref:galectin-8 n=1 Tax=Tribolium castaneum TaxID=7070 RepID=UPI0000D55CF9|nr:PREDICTED: galectin-8 isoform X1 [Tribolium castaneum]|eukprot:XP_971732.1 PREDICTED: galectin-8 isoform X1 [Tribolium castaneum]
MSVETEKQVKCCCFSKNSKQVEMASQNKTESSLPTAKVPFAADLPDLCAGKAIYVTGVVLPKCSRFAVNLTCGKSPTADVAFHLNPRLLQHYIVRNTRLNGQWGDEEKTSTVKFPFRREGKFNVCILIGDGEFQVAVEGVFFCSYKFRVALAKITAIDIQGCVDVLGVDCKQLQIYPEIGPGTVPNVSVGHREADTPKVGMDTPVTFLLPGGFQRDWQLEIYGRVKILPHSFYVNLQEGSHRWPHPRIPLHLNPRFSMGSGEPLFVRNAWIDGGWGQEERTPGFQFAPGSPFTMAIRRGSDHFSVWIDGKLAGEFKFRGTVDNTDTVHMEGDVVIFDVRLNQPL